MAASRKPGLRRLLDALYGASSNLAALFLAAIAAIVLMQIITRAMGLKISGLDDFAAWSMAATVFLALPGTLAKGGHIRVLLILETLPARAARILELVAALTGLAVSLWAAWSVLRFVWTSFRLGDVTQGELVMPLWIPQLSMAIGFVLLAVALLEQLIDAISRLPSGTDDADKDLRLNSEGL